MHYHHLLSCQCGLKSLLWMEGVLKAKCGGQVKVYFLDYCCCKSNLHFLHSAYVNKEKSISEPIERVGIFDLLSYRADKSCQFHGREGMDPVFSVDAGVFLWQNEKVAFNTGRDTEGDKISLRPLFSTGHQQQTRTFITKLIALLPPTGGGVGSGGRKSQKESQNKLSYPPSSPASGKMCRNNSILFIISGFVSLWSTDKELSITVPAGDLRIPLCPDTICSRFTLSSTQRQCQGTNFLLLSWIKNLIHLPLCTSIKADKSGEEAHYQAVLSASTVV